MVCRFSGTHEPTQQVAHNANDDQCADSIKEPLVVVGKPMHAGILSSGFRETPPGALVGKPNADGRRSSSLQLESNLVGTSCRASVPTRLRRGWDHLRQDYGFSA